MKHRTALLLVVFVSCFILAIISIIYATFLLPQFVNTGHAQKNIDVDYYLVGDSHLFNGVRGEFLNGTYVYSYDSISYVEFYYIASFFSQYNSIETAILQIDPHIFTKVRNKQLFDDSERFFHITPYETIRTYTNYSYLDYVLGKYVGGANPFGTGDRLVSYLFTKEPPSTGTWTNATTLLLSQSDEERSLYLDLTMQSQFGHGPLIYNKSFGYFDLLVSSLQSKNITVVLISYPLSNEYVLAMDERNIDYVEFYTFAQEYATSKNISYFNYFDRIEDAYFADADHLHYTGAELFTKMLKTDLEQLT